MKKTMIVLVTLSFLLLCVSSVMAEEEINAVYGETYMCGNAYTARVVSQPQMMAQIAEKINAYVYRKNQQTGRYTPYQVNVRYGQQTEEDVLLTFRVQIRNLNPEKIQGLSSKSFILTGKVRDRVIQYEPEIMIPFTMKTEEWIYYLKRNETLYYLNRTLPDSIIFDLADYWNPLLLSEKNIDSMRLQEIRLIYRVPSWLVGWDLHISPKPMTADSELKTCDLTLHLPTIMNEITRETYKYIY